MSTTQKGGRVSSSACEKTSSVVHQNGIYFALSEKKIKSTFGPVMSRTGRQLGDHDD